MWGNTIVNGTLSGNAENVGVSTVNNGTSRIKFELLGLSKLAISLLLYIITIEKPKAIHSIVMFVGLVMLKPVPNGLVVNGHSNCV